MPARRMQQKDSVESSEFRRIGRIRLLKDGNITKKSTNMPHKKVNVNPFATSVSL